MTRPTVSLGKLARKSQEKPFSISEHRSKTGTKKSTKPKCIKCEPRLHLTEEDHSPAYSELSFINAEGWVKYLGLEDQYLAFIQMFGYTSYLDCVTRGYSPHLNQEEIENLGQTLRAII